MKLEEKLGRIFLVLGILTLVLCITLSCKGQQKIIPFDTTIPTYQKTEGKAIVLIAYFAANFLVSEYAIKANKSNLYSTTQKVFVGSIPVALVYVSYDFPIKHKKGYKVKSRHKKYYYN